ncbi:hypothetical protein [Roseovarius sp. MBR-6]|uniref:hypothetical protein n=1 Tax=Roseovarius sp. MBR-6 TaxID=3156459 RepID=UPI0033951CBA
MRLTIDPGTGDVILDYGADLPLTVDMFVTQGASTVTLSLEPPTFVGDVSSPYPSTIVEVA